MSIKQAERLMVEAKSDRYPIAVNWLKRAKKHTHSWGRPNSGRRTCKRSKSNTSGGLHSKHS
jgi:hypothetical protein